MLDIRNLTHTFGALKAVDGVSFRVEPGRIFGLLGPNGAGKTTTISCICGLLRPDGGTIELDGVSLAGDPIAFKKRIGTVPQETALYGDLSARENLRFWGGLAGLHGAELRGRVDEVLEAVGLARRAKEATRKFSGGMKRRLNLAVGMLHRPRLLLLDEPTAGIDPQARIHILDIVRQVAAEGTIVLYTTHYLEEAQDLCKRIAILDHGRILAEGSLEELKRIVGEGQILTLRGAFAPAAIQSWAEAEPRIRIVSAEEGHAILEVGSEAGDAAAALERILGQGISLDDISIQPPSLQSLFLKLTGRNLRD